jgi:hypothetical protein
MKHILLIAAIALLVSCSKDKDRKVEVRTNQLVRHSQDSTYEVFTSETYMMSKGENFRREIKGKTWPPAWSGPTNVDVSITSTHDGKVSTIYNEHKLNHDIDIKIP